MATGNHYWLDIAAGVGVALVGGTLVAWAQERRLTAAPRSTAAPTGAGSLGASVSTPEQAEPPKRTYQDEVAAWRAGGRGPRADEGRA